MCKPSTEETSCVQQPAIHTAHRFSLQISVSSLSLELHRFQIHLSTKSIHILYTSRQMLIGVAVNVGRRDGMSLHVMSVTTMYWTASVLFYRKRTSLCGIGPEAGLVQCIPRDARGSAQTSSL
ncbi:hypothetical protein YC2023_081261 [Brassica napus]|uniref:Uncharacterized protein n=1 Tax=Brassica oleracea TaxID=3712 RepID=A0A3P6ERD2_BRAOL|nr:unnamed protein product [Brassica oleracea]